MKGWGIKGITEYCFKDLLELWFDLSFDNPLRMLPTKISDPSCDEDPWRQAGHFTTSILLFLGLFCKLLGYPPNNTHTCKDTEKYQLAWGTSNPTIGYACYPWSKGKVYIYILYLYIERDISSKLLWGEIMGTMFDVPFRLVWWG